MHGIICKSIEAFVTVRHGEACWRDVASAAGVAPDGIETTRRYPDEVGQRLCAAAAQVLGMAPRALLEDLGTWVCTHPPLEPIRRLIRFSGASFEEMLFALDEVHERAHMALPDLDLPVLSLIEQGGGRFRIASTWGSPGAGSVVIGILRAMADDYGALAFLEFEHGAEVNGAWAEILTVQMLDADHGAPRAFALGGAA